MTESLTATFAEKVDGGTFVHSVEVVREEVYAVALVRIADLEAENEKLREAADATMKRLVAEGQRRINKAEAELAKANKWLAADEPWIQVQEAKEELAKMRVRLDDCLRGHYGLQPTARAEEGGGDG